MALSSTSSAQLPALPSCAGRHAKRPAAAAGRLGCCGQASWPRTVPGFARPELLSEINVAQPALSQGSATVVAMGHLLGYAHVSADQFEAGEESA
jgi:hypothetical protein